MLLITRSQQTLSQDSPGRAQILGFITNFKDLMFLKHGVFQAVCV